jgi:AcrR family transcriptional regulator
MPRAARSQNEVDFVKKEILDMALQLIIDNGFHNFSMRKLAQRLNMTATTIYNYFSNKDEINLMIRMRGFEILYSRLQRSYNQNPEPFVRFRAMIRTYFDFGIRYHNYYDIMFNLNTPKYLDYVGTGLEGVAHTEKEASLRNFEVTARAITDILALQGPVDPVEVRYRTIRIWSEVHGIISLHNSRLIKEIEDNPEALLARMIEDVIAHFLENNGSGMAEAALH